jgi:hypothetical protein
MGRVYPIVMMQTTWYFLPQKGIFLFLTASPDSLNMEYNIKHMAILLFINHKNSEYQIDLTHPKRFRKLLWSFISSRLTKFTNKIILNPQR